MVLSVWAGAGVAEPSTFSLSSSPSFFSSGLSFLTLPSARACSRRSDKEGSSLPCFWYSLVKRLIMASSRLDMTPFFGGLPGPLRLAGMSSGATPTRTDPAGRFSGITGGVSEGVVVLTAGWETSLSTEILTSAGCGGGGISGGSEMVGFSTGLMVFSALSGCSMLF